jgi:hypothetical protein
VLTGEPVRQLIVLKSQTPFLIKGIESDVFDIDFELGNEPRALHPLQLQLKPKSGDLGAETQGTIRFLTDSADRPEIEIGAVFRRKAPAPATGEQIGELNESSDK